jgi:hypothetical protein
MVSQIVMVGGVHVVAEQIPRAGNSTISSHSYGKSITIHGSLHSKVFFFFFCLSKKPIGNRTNGLQLGFVGEAARDLFL